MVATAMAASAVSRAAESVRKLLAEAAPPPALDRPAAPAFLEPPALLTAEAPMRIDPAGQDRVIAAQAAPGHEFGPTPLVAPSHGIGFRSEPRRREPAAEMPIISRPSRDEPERPDTVPPAEPVILPKPVHTAATIVQDIDDDHGLDVEPDVETVEEPRSEEPAAAPSELVAEEADEPQDEQIEPAAEEYDRDPEPVRALRLTAPPVEDTPIAAASAPAEDEFIEPVGDPEPTVAEPSPAPQQAAVDEPARAEVVDEKSDRTKGKHRRHLSAISGTVQSSRGRGLHGMRVTVLDNSERVIGTAVSGTGGAFVVEDLPAGSYRLTASDEVGSAFAAGWHGGMSFANADTLNVKQGKTRRKADVTLVSAAAIELDVDVRDMKAVVAITVTDRAAGAPAEGSVRISTKRFSTELPLTKGRTEIALFGSADGSPRLSKKVTVDYLGTTHVLPGSATIRLR
jgi:hypothetical protein